VARLLVLLRHGVTDWNREGRWQGRLDPPLGADGEREAALLARRLWADPELRPARIVTSPLARARDTARLVADGTGVNVDERLAEIGAGEWEGRTHAELERDDPERYLEWRAGDARGTALPPGGEPLDAVRGRSAAWVAESVASDAWPLWAVSHGGLIRIIAAKILGIDEEVTWRFDVDNASLSVLLELDEGGWRIERWNDVGHLLGRAPLHVDEAEGQPLAL
jgi:probable phosphoglycerate mutase